MKKLLLTALLSLVTVAGFPCTNLIVGKLASVDGSVMCTYNCDSFGFLQPLDWFAAGKHAPGEMLAIRGWGPQSPSAAGAPSLPSITSPRRTTPTASWA